MRCRGTGRRSLRVRECALTPRRRRGHPQLALTPDGGAAIVWDEVSAGMRRVSFTRVSRAGVFQPVRTLSGDGRSASNPVIVLSDGTLVVAWTSRSSAAKAASIPPSSRCDGSG